MTRRRDAQGCKGAVGIGLALAFLLGIACYPNPDELRSRHGQGGQVGQGGIVALGGKGAPALGGAGGTMVAATGGQVVMGSGGAGPMGGRAGGTSGSMGGAQAAGGRAAAGGGPGTGGASGMGGRAASGGAGGTPIWGTGPSLMPDRNGWISRASNGFGVQGSWYAMADGHGPDGSAATSTCVSAGYAAGACSAYTSPSAVTGFPNTGGRMCTAGTVGMVVNNALTGKPDYSAIWGAGIGFDLNYDTSKGTYDAVANHVTGITFDLSVQAYPAFGFRVSITTPLTEGQPTGDDYWGATAMYVPSPLTMGTNKVYFSDFAGPTGIALDTTRLQTIHFDVPTSDVAKTDYGFCISNVALLTDPMPTCTDPSLPVACRAHGGAAAGCFPAGTSCLSLISCGGATHFCPDSTGHYDCVTGACMNCPTSVGPVYCPTLGAVPAGCWAPNIACGTVVACGANYLGCKDPTYHVECTMLKCSPP